MLEAGERLGGFVITELLGVGGMGEVYLARDSTLDGRKVALKLVRRGAQTLGDAKARLLREAKTVANLNHPNICTLHHIGEADGQLYIVMEYVEGPSLRDLIAESGAMDLDTVVRIGARVAAALQHAHDRGVVHRDLKPDNIMLTPEGEPKVLDFGLASRQARREIESSMWSSESLEENPHGGTLHYMAPETLREEDSGHLVDVWALGVTLYELSTGHKPFQGRTFVDLSANITRDPPTPLPADQDPGFQSVVMKCLRKDPRQRSQRVDEIRVALETIEIGRTFPMAPARPKRESTRRRIPKEMKRVLIGLVVAFAVVVLLILVWPEPPSLRAAVLPFAGESQDQPGLGRVVADSLIVQLQQVPGLEVAPWYDVRELEVDPQDATAIAETAQILGVQWLVGGTFETKPNEVRLVWRLVGDSGELVESGSEDGRLDYIGPPLSAIAQAVRSALPLPESAQSGTMAALRTADIEALELYNRARDVADTQPSREQLREAIGTFENAIRIDPTFAAAYAGLGSAHLSLYVRDTADIDLEAARDAIERAISLGPNLPETRLAEGMFYLVTGDSMAAARALEQALDLAPGNDAAMRQIAWLYVSLDRYDEAQDSFLRAIDLRDFWANHYGYARFLIIHRGDENAAEPHLKRALELNPGGTSAVIALAATHIFKGELDLAEGLLLPVLERGTNSIVLTSLGLVAYSRGDWALALQYYNQALELSPDSPLYQANVGDALRQLGQDEEAAQRYGAALANYDKLLETSPQDDEYRSQRSLVLAAVGECDRAREDLRRVMSDNPDSTLFGYYSAVVAGRCKDYDEAEAIVLRLIERDQFIFALESDPDLGPVLQRPDVIAALETRNSEPIQTSP